MTNLKNMQDSEKGIPGNPINENRIVQKNYYLPKYKKILLNLHLDKGTEKKKVDDIINDPGFIKSLNLKSFQELTDFLHEFLEFFGYLGVSESLINELFERIFKENPSEKLRGFIEDRKRYIKLRIINGRYVKSRQLQSVFPDKHKQLIDLKTNNLKKFKFKKKLKISKRKNGVKKKTKKKITELFNNRDFKTVNHLGSKSSIHTVKK
jgi:hypothetical protein